MGRVETGLTCIELSKARSQEEDVKLLRTFDKAVPKQSRAFMINFLDQSQERSMTGDCYYRLDENNHKAQLIIGYCIHGYLLTDISASAALCCSTLGHTFNPGMYISYSQFFRSIVFAILFR